jgi:hypothetical protein
LAAVTIKEVDCPAAIETGLAVIATVGTPPPPLEVELFPQLVSIASMQRKRTETGLLPRSDGLANFLNVMFTLDWTLRTPADLGEFTIDAGPALATSASIFVEGEGEATRRQRLAAFRHRAGEFAFYIAGLNFGRMKILATIPRPAGRMGQASGLV